MVNGVRDQLRSIIFTGSAALGAVFFSSSFYSYSHSQRFA